MLKKISVKADSFLILAGVFVLIIAGLFVYVINTFFKNYANSQNIEETASSLEYLNEENLNKAVEYLKKERYIPLDSGF